MHRPQKDVYPEEKQHGPLPLDEEDDSEENEDDETTQFGNKLKKIRQKKKNS